jgi:ligand-binding sensor domain-containing protein
MRSVSLLFLTLAALAGKAQHILKNKLEGCIPQQFCLDCGEPKASINPQALQQFLASLSQNESLKNAIGQCAFQVVVDSSGGACLLSYDGNVGEKTAKLLSAKLAQFTGWKPAVDNGKPTTSSIILVVDLSETIRAVIHRIALSANEANMNNPGTPEIQNKQYRYINEHLNNYEFTVWTKANSPMPYDMSRAITVDQNDVVWHGTDNALVRFYKDSMKVFNKTNSVFKTKYKFMTIAAAETDTDNNKWFDANDKIYKYDGSNWTVYDSVQAGFKNAFSITATKDGKVLFGSYNGLAIYDKGKWSLLTTKNSKLPSNHVSYAYTDSKGRMWIGTYAGSIMLSKEGVATEFNRGNTPLTNLCITDMVEDADGTLWFATYDYNEKNRMKLAKLDNRGNWIYYDVQNSGLPVNQVNKLLSDNRDNILWLTVHNVGLVRFDKKENWQVYTNQNSGVPSTYIFDMQQDSEGNLWCATFSGLLRVSRKK